MRTPGAVGIALLAVTCVLSACAGEGGGGAPATRRLTCQPPAGGTTVSFTSNIQPIFNASCALPACHIPPVPGGALDLTAGRSYDQLVGVRATGLNRIRVVRGKPDESYLVQKIEGTPGIAGAPMPQNCPTALPCLTPDQIQAIRQWIDECAPRN